MSARTICRLIPLCFMLFTAPLYAQQVILFNGGIGADERAQAPAEGTRLVFFVSSGSFLSDVRVTVKDLNGKVIAETTTRGPWLILRLAPGRYQVHAEIDGQAQGGYIDVEGSSSEFAFMFRERN